MGKAKQFILVSVAMSLTACDLEYVVSSTAERMEPAHDFNVTVTRGLPLNANAKRVRIWGDYGQMEVDYKTEFLPDCPRAMTLQQEGKVLSYSLDDDEKQTIQRALADDCAVRYANEVDVYMKQRIVNAQSFDE